MPSNDPGYRDKFTTVSAPLWLYLWLEVFLDTDDVCMR